jgi:hypothetical protein
MRVVGEWCWRVKAMMACLRSLSTDGASSGFGALKIGELYFSNA